MDKLVSQLKKDFTRIEFIPGDDFCWQASEQSVVYNETSIDQSASWLLIHELAHGVLGHVNFTSDFGLLKQEVQAWAKAKELAVSYKVKIADDYIEECLDTYRDWLYARSACPRCSNACLQIDNKSVYLCHNCSFSWCVSKERFCRPYRLASSEEQVNV